MTAEASDSSSAPLTSPDGKPSSWMLSSFPFALGVACAVIAIDQLTKASALANLEKGSPVGVFWKLQWNLHFNTGSAFSLGPGLGPFIGVLAIIVSIGLLWYARAIVGRLPGVLLGLIAGGAIGNVIDRLFREEGGDGFMKGAVVDFIDFQFWPIFNVADMAIVVGAIALAVWSFFQPEPAELAKEEAELAKEEAELAKEEAEDAELTREEAEVSADD